MITVHLSFRAPLARIDEQLRFTAMRVIADGDAVVVEARRDNHTKEGVRYRSRYCFVIHVVHGRIMEVAAA